MKKVTIANSFSLYACSISMWTMSLTVHNCTFWSYCCQHQLLRLQIMINKVHCNSLKHVSIKIERQIAIYEKILWSTTSKHCSSHNRYSRVKSPIFFQSLNHHLNSCGFSGFHNHNLFRSAWRSFWGQARQWRHKHHTSTNMAPHESNQ